MMVILQFSPKYYGNTGGYAKVLKDYRREEGLKRVQKGLHKL